MLKGYRDRPPADLEAIAATLVKLSQLLVDIEEIAELDINPLLADHHGVLALDARIVVSRARRPRFAIRRLSVAARARRRRPGPAAISACARSVPRTSR